jgi:hypothetical protein
MIEFISIACSYARKLEKHDYEGAAVLAEALVGMAALLPHECKMREASYGAKKEALKAGREVPPTLSEWLEINRLKVEIQEEGK